MSEGFRQDFVDTGQPLFPRLPRQWSRAQLGRVAYVKGRIGWHGLRSDEFIDSGPWLVTGSDFTQGRVDWSACKRISSERYEEDPYIHLEDGDLLITKDGTIGKLAVVAGMPGPASLNSGVFVVRPLSDSWIARYLYYVLSSRIFDEFIELESSGTTINHLYQNVFERFPFPLPPLPAQWAIADYLDSETSRLGSLIDRKQRFIELLLEKRTALITHAVTKGLDPNVKMKDSGVEWIGLVPRHWRPMKLKHLLSAPLTYGAAESAELTDRSLPRYIRITDITADGDLRDETFRSLPREVAGPYLLKDKDILLARSGATVGKAFIFSASWGPAAYAGYLIRARLQPSRAVARFFWYFTQTYSYQQWASQILVQATIPNINAEKYANLVLPVCGPNEQTAIVEYLDSQLARFDDLAARTHASIGLLKEYRTALISAAVTGQIDIPAADSGEDVA